MNFRKPKSEGRKDNAIHHGDTEFTEKDSIDLGKNNTNEINMWGAFPKRITPRRDRIGDRALQNCHR